MSHHLQNKGLHRTKHDTTEACRQGKFSKCILKASVDTEYARNSNLLDPLYF